MVPRPWQLAVLLLVAGLGAPPAGAHHGFPGGHLPLLEGGEVSGGGWVAIRFEAGGQGDFAYEHWAFSQDSTALQLGARLYDDRDDAKYGRVVTGLALQDGVRVHVGALGVEEGAVEPRFGAGFVGTGDAWDGTSRMRLSGTYTLLLWGVGTGEANWTYYVRGGPGIVVLGVSSGPDVHLLLSGDFETETEAQARGVENSAYPQANLGAQAVAGGVHHASARGRLVASFDGFNGVVARDLKVTLPDGRLIRCPCFFDRTPPGDYAFEVTALGVEAGGVSGEVFLAVLDVSFPR